MPGGRPRKPIEEHLRDGTTPHGAGAHARPTLIGGREAPDKPAGLDQDATAVWELVVEDLTEGNVLDAADWPAIEEFAVMVARARQARRAIEWAKRDHAKRRREGADDADPNPYSHLTQPGQKGSATQSVFLQIEREAWREARQVGDSLGLSPKARAGLGLKVKGAGRRQGQDAGRRGVPERAGRGGLGVVQGGRS